MLYSRFVPIEGQTCPAWTMICNATPLAEIFLESASKSYVTFPTEDRLLSLEELECISAFMSVGVPEKMST